MAAPPFVPTTAGAPSLSSDSSTASSHYALHHCKGLAFISLHSSPVYMRCWGKQSHTITTSPLLVNAADANPMHILDDGEGNVMSYQSIPQNTRFMTCAGNYSFSPETSVYRCHGIAVTGISVDEEELEAAEDYSDLPPEKRVVRLGAKRPSDSNASLDSSLDESISGTSVGEFLNQFNSVGKVFTLPDKCIHSLREWMTSLDSNTIKTQTQLAANTSKSIIQTISSIAFDTCKDLGSPIAFGRTTADRVQLISSRISTICGRCKAILDRTVSILGRVSPS